jgi:hypothetical protein
MIFDPAYSAISESWLNRVVHSIVVAFCVGCGGYLPMLGELMISCMASSLTLLGRFIFSRGNSLEMCQYPYCTFAWPSHAISWTWCWSTKTLHSWPAKRLMWMWMLWIFDCMDGAAVVQSSTRAESSNSIFPTLGYMFSICSRRMWFDVSLLGKVWMIRSVFMCVYLMSPLHVHGLQLVFSVGVAPRMLQRTEHIFCYLCPGCACSVLCGIVDPHLYRISWERVSCEVWLVMIFGGLDWGSEVLLYIVIALRFFYVRMSVSVLSCCYLKVSFPNAVIVLWALLIN